MQEAFVPQRLVSPGVLVSGKDRFRTVAACAAATLLVAVCAHMSVALPFTPVPVVLSDFAVLLVGMLLGPAAGAAALLAYLAEGATGLPVFSPHGAGGLAQLFGPTGGFLLSYPLVAWVAGAAFQRLRRRIPPTAAALTAGLASSLPLFLLGAGWLSVILHLNVGRALQLAVFPFLLGAVAKIIVAAAVASSLIRLRAALRP